MIAFLESNGFYPRNDELESILRRCDHDANQSISYSEFVEITCGRPVTVDTYEEDRHQHSPEHKRLQDDLNSSRMSLKKSNSRTELLEEPLSETYDRLQTPEKLSNKPKQQPDEQIRKKLNFENEESKGEAPQKTREVPMKHRFVDLVIQQLRFDKDIESVKESLFCFENFNLVDSFKRFDSNGRGSITHDSLKILAGDMDVDAIIKYLDADQDGRLSYTEWTRALTPKNLAYAAVVGKRASNLGQHEMKARENSWFGELKNLLHLYSRAATFNRELK